MTKTGGRWLVLAFIAIIVMAGLAACGDDKPTVPPASSTTPSPTPSTPEEVATAEASDALDHFLDVTSEMKADPTQPIAELDEVAISAALIEEKGRIEGYRAQGVVFLGESEEISRKVKEVKLKDKPPSIIFETCTDGSDVRFEKDGKSVEPPGGRSGATLDTYWVSKYKDKWQVSVRELGGRNSC